MRFGKGDTEVPRAEEPFCDAARGRGSPVRLPLLSREFLLLMLVLGVAACFVGVVQENGPELRQGSRTIPGHTSVLEKVIFEPDGRVLISCGWDRKVKSWIVAEEDPWMGQEIDCLPVDWHIFGLSISGDGKYLAASGVGGFGIWGRASQNAAWELLHQHGGASYRCLAASPAAHLLATGGSDGVVRLWNMETAKELRVVDRFGDDLRMIEFSPSGVYLAAVAFSGEFRTWDLKSADSSRFLVGHLSSVRSFVFAPDERTLAIAQQGPQVRSLGLWELPVFEPGLKFWDNHAGNNALAFSSDGRLMASADQDATIRIWDTRTGKLEDSFRDGVGWVKTLAFSPDGRHLAYGGRNGTIQIHDYSVLGSPERQTHGS